MRMRKLGTSDLEVSALCLGTMTYGTQTNEADAHAQMDMALEAGINFLDTAEMYPTTPMSADTIGRTEEIIGTWVAASGKRDQMLIATKITGKNGGMVRDGRGIFPDTIVEAVEGSLTRLQTDVIDLYQLHWPNRGSYHFRQNWTYTPEFDRAEVEGNMAAVLDVMGRLQKEGKIRHVGLSNESAWGTAAWLRLANETGGPRMVSIQNEYSLMCRTFDTDLAELAMVERVDLLSFSPLACGLLTGKYVDGVVPEGSRRAVSSENLGGRMNPRVGPAVDAYLEIARRHELSPVVMALAFAMQRPFMGSVIFGATTAEQLDLALEAADVVLSDAVLEEITQAHRLHPMPY